MESSQQAHCDLILWVHCELDKFPQNELTVTHGGWAFCDFCVSSHWVSCELKLFTGCPRHVPSLHIYGKSGPGNNNYQSSNWINYFYKLQWWNQNNAQKLLALLVFSYFILGNFTYWSNNKYKSKSLTNSFQNSVLKSIYCCWHGNPQIHTTHDSHIQPGTEPKLWCHELHKNCNCSVLFAPSKSIVKVMLKMKNTTRFNNCILTVNNN